MPGRERRRARLWTEHVEAADLLRRTRAVDRALQRGGRETGDEHRGGDCRHEQRAAPEDGSGERDREPQDPVRARVGETHEDRVEQPDPVAGDPGLESAVDSGQGPPGTVVVTVTVIRVAGSGSTVRILVTAGPEAGDDFVAWPRATPSAKTTPKATVTSTTRSSRLRKVDRRPLSAPLTITGCSPARHGSTGGMPHRQRMSPIAPIPAADIARRSPPATRSPIPRRPWRARPARTSRRSFVATPR
jgi:hypothetical protein